MLSFALYALFLTLTLTLLLPSYCITVVIRS